jgi:flagellar biosynthesis protein FlhG
VILLGTLPGDQTISQAVRKQIPFIQLNEKAPASKALHNITEKYCQGQFDQASNLNRMNFVAKLKRFLFER